jgi:hypothetical protein
MPSNFASVVALILATVSCAAAADRVDDDFAVNYRRLAIGAAVDRANGAELLNVPLQIRPQSEGRLLLTYGPYAHHTGRGNYNSRCDFRAIEWEFPSRWSIGAATFRNSFAQPCEYAFVGRRFILKHHSGRFFAKLTGGIIHGYQAPHRHAVPLNWDGFNPALIPSLGYEYKGVSFQLAVFGRAWGAVPMMGTALR